MSNSLSLLFPIVILKAHSFRYVKSLLISTAVLGLVVYLGSFMEFVRKASKKTSQPFDIVPEMAFLETFIFLPTFFPFIVLFGTSAVFRQLSATQELTALKSAGYSGWQILSPAVVVIFATWLFLLAIINPITANMQARLDDIKFKYLNIKTIALEIGETGLWVRQAVGDTIVYLNTGHTNIRDANELGDTFSDLALSFTDENGTLIKSYHAREANVQNEDWLLKDVVVTEPGKSVVELAELKLVLPISVQTIEENFADPSTVSVWNLPAFIKRMERSGLNTTPHVRQLHAELSRIVMAMAMLCFAYLYNGSLQSDRKATVKAIALSTGFGFAVYMLASLLASLAEAALLSPALVVWSGNMIALMLGLSALLIREER